MAFIWLTLGAVFLSLNGGSLYPRARAAPAGIVEAPRPASLASVRLPAGGGGKSHFFQECSAALVPGGIGRDAAKPMRLPDKLRPYAENPIKSVMDYTRLAVLTALDEAFAEVTAFGEARTPLRRQLKTGDEVECVGRRPFRACARARARTRPVQRDDATDARPSLHHARPHPATAAHRYRLIPWEAVEDRCDYAEAPEHCDMHTWTSQQAGTPLRNAPYDVIFFSQTFEHLYDLPLALARNRALVAPGGFVWVSVPGWNIYHMAPSHQQNLSPCGLFAQLTAAGFDVVRLGWFHNANYSEYLTTPGHDWPPWPYVPDAPDPFTDIPLGATAVGRANTVWALARAPLQAPPPPPPLAVDFATRPVISWSDMNAAQSLRNMIPYRATFVWPSAWAMTTVLGVFPAWIDDDVAHVVFAASFLEALVPLVGADGAVFACGRTARAVVDALAPRGSRVIVWEPPASGGGGARQRGRARASPSSRISLRRRSTRWARCRARSRSSRRARPSSSRAAAPTSSTPTRPG
jgi:hypothetical protein